MRFSFSCFFALLVSACELGGGDKCGSWGNSCEPAPAPTTTGTSSDPPAPAPSGFSTLPPAGDTGDGSGGSDAGGNDRRCPPTRPTNGAPCSNYQDVGGCRYELLQSGGTKTNETCNCIVVNDEDMWECVKDR